MPRIPFTMTPSRVRHFLPEHTFCSVNGREKPSNTRICLVFIWHKNLFPWISEKLKNPQQLKKMVMREQEWPEGVWEWEQEGIFHILIFRNQKRMEWETSSKNSETVGDRKKKQNLEFGNGIRGFRSQEWPISNTVNNNNYPVIEKIGNNSNWWKHFH